MPAELDEAFVEDNEAADGVAEAGAAAVVAGEDVATAGDFSLLLVVIFVVGGCSSLEELQ